MPAIKEKLEFEKCPYCGSTDIDYSEVDDLWHCNYCWQSWDEEGIAE